MGTVVNETQTLTTYYVQEGVSNNGEGDQRWRVFMDTRLHAGCMLVREINAIDWQDARSQLPG